MGIKPHMTINTQKARQIISKCFAITFYFNLAGLLPDPRLTQLPAQHIQGIPAEVNRTPTLHL
jgi:hypothetical protein